MKKYNYILLPLFSLVGALWSSVTMANLIEMDEQDRQVLAKLSPEKQAAFDKEFREAVALYYDNAYPLSLPLFRSLAHRVGTLDLLYWYGLAAQRSGKPDLAITKFSAILERNPELHQVRRDLASAYWQKGDRKRAEAEMQKVASPESSPENQGKVTQAGKNLDRMSKRLFSTLRVSAGVQNDNNINAQPEDKLASLFADKEGGIGFPVSGSLDLLYDFGEKRGTYVWHNTLSFYRITHQDTSDFDYSQVDFRSGWEYYSKQWQLKLPLGWISRQFSHTSLSDSWYLAPEVGYALKKDLHLNLAYRVEKEYSDVHQDQDNITHMALLNPQWFFADSTRGYASLLSLQADYARRDAEGISYSYQGHGLGSAWFSKWQSGLETLLQAHYLDRRYEANSGTSLDLDFDIPSKRRDQRLTSSAMIRQKFMDYYSISATYAYTHNQSNDRRFEYDKSVVGVNLGVTLNF